MVGLSAERSTTLVLTHTLSGTNCYRAQTEAAFVSADLIKLYDAVQFQLTVNFVALVLSFVAAISNGETPLTVIQLLWVNLIMDALGALGKCCPANPSFPFKEHCSFMAGVILLCKAGRGG